MVSAIKMDKATEEWIKAVSKIAIVGILAALVRLFLAKGEPPLRLVKILLAGVTVSTMLAIILTETTWSPLWQKIACGFGGAFVSTAWPRLESMFNRWLNKKGNDIIRDTDRHKHGR